MTRHLLAALAFLAACRGPDPDGDDTDGNDTAVTTSAFDDPCEGREVDLCDETGCHIDADLQTVEFSGTLLWDGVPVDEPSRHLWLLFEDPTGGGFQAWVPATPTWTVHTWPGTYDVWFRLDIDETDVIGEISGFKLLLDDVELTSSMTGFQIAPTLVDIGGSLSWDGDTLTSDDVAIVYFTDVATGDVFTTWVRGGTTWQTRMYPGTYDVSFSMRYEWPYVANDVVVDGTTTLDIAATRTTLTLDATLPADAVAQGAPQPQFQLVERTTQTEWGVGSGTNSVRPGDYDIWAVWQSPLGGTGDTRHKIAEHVVVDGPTEVHVEIPLYPVTLDASWDGQPLLGDDTDWSHFIEFVDVQNGDDTRRRYDPDDPEPIWLPAGTYEAWLASTQGPTSVHYNVLALVTDSLVVSGPTTLEAHLETVPIEGSFAIGGEPLASTLGNLVFANSTGQYTWVAVDSGASEWSGRVLPGLWDVFLTNANSLDYPAGRATVGRNVEIRAGIPSVLDVDLEPLPYSMDVLVDGVATEDWRLFGQNSLHGTWWTIDPGTDGPQTLWWPGTYRISLSVFDVPPDQGVWGDRLLQECARFE